VGVERMKCKKLCQRDEELLFWIEEKEEEERRSTPCEAKGMERGGRRERVRG